MAEERVRRAGAPAEAGGAPGEGGGGPPPGPRGLPLVGCGPAFARDQLGFLTSLHRRYGGAATIPLGPRRRLFFFAAPEAVARILVENARNYTSREVNRPSMPFLGDGLLNIDAPAHREQRAIVQPAFGRQRVDASDDLILGEVDRMLRGWRAGAALDLHEEMRALTLRIAALAFLRHDLGDEAADWSRAFDAVIRFQERRGLARLLEWDVAFLPYGRMRAGERFLDARIEGLIAGRRASGLDRGDVLSLLLGGPGGTACRQVRDHVVTLLAAGHETTANALTFAFHLLGRNPEAFRALRAEIARELVGRPPRAADLPRLPVLDATIRETLRLLPPAWIVGRRAVADDEVCGHRVPAGGFCVLSQWVTQRSPRYWADPGRFRPERWMPEAQARTPTPPHAYFPFGGGPRMCIGMPFALLEARIALARILQRFVPEALPGQRLVLQPAVTLRPVGGTRVRLGAA